MPWVPLSLAAPVGPFTTRKIDALADNTAFCHSLLDEAARKFSILPPVKSANNCGYSNGVALENGSDQNSYRINYRPAAKTSCPMAASLVLWERQILIPAAFRHLGVTIDEVVLYGSYSCRRINNASTGSFSEHATANAIDIAAFRLSDGRVISVAGHWNAQDERSAFLKEVRDGACTIFATTLSPDYDAAHADHLHLDQAGRNGGHYCR